jgi:uncharacterized protein (TIGR00661 family)
MVRILYGVHGTGRGHAIRALTVARHYGSHEFLFVCHGEAARLIGAEFRVFECPNPITPVRGHRVDVGAALLRTASTVADMAHWKRKLRQRVEDFGANVAITDYEFFVPRVADMLDIPCISLDNQHAITLGAIAYPLSQAASMVTTYLAIRLLFSSADRYLISCFFEARKHVPGLRVDWVPPLLRSEVIELCPDTGDHVVAYQGYPTLRRFVEVLSSLNRPVYVYGAGAGADFRNLSFREFHERDFLKDLAGCAYVVCGGGHTLISEALHLGKPVLSIPVRGAFEQYLNSYYVERCGYGKQSSMANFSTDEVGNFEKNLDSYRNRIHQGCFCGNDAAFALLDDFIGQSGRHQTA